MVDYTRKTVEVYTHTDVDIKYGTLSDALDHINELIKMYGKDARILDYDVPYSDTMTLGVYIKRPETDEEMQSRITTEEKWEKRREEQEKQTFERLKAKFG